MQTPEPHTPAPADGGTVAEPSTVPTPDPAARETAPSTPSTDRASVPVPIAAEAVVVASSSAPSAAKTVDVTVTTDDDWVPKRYRHTFTQLDDPLILECIEKCKTLAAIANRVGCCRGALADYIRSRPVLFQAWQDSRESINDLAESRIIEKVDAGDIEALKFYMTHQMRHRGYGDREIVEQKNEQKRVIIGHIDASEIPDENAVPPEPDTRKSPPVDNDRSAAESLFPQKGSASDAPDGAPSADPDLAQEDADTSAERERLDAEMAAAAAAGGAIPDQEAAPEAVEQPVAVEDDEGERSDAADDAFGDDGGDDFAQALEGGGEFVVVDGFSTW